MNRNRSKKLKGKGWNGIAIELKETENFDLLNLVEMNPNKYPYFLESSSRGNDIKPILNCFLQTRGFIS